MAAAFDEKFPVAKARMAARNMSARPARSVLLLRRFGIRPSNWLKGRDIPAKFFELAEKYGNKAVESGVMEGKGAKQFNAPPDSISV